MNTNNKNKKIFLAMAICLVFILLLWFYTLKLNLSKNSDHQFSWSELFSDTSQVFENIPQMPKFEQPTSTASTATGTDDLLQEISDRLQNQEIDTINPSE